MMRVPNSIAYLLIGIIFVVSLGLALWFPVGSLVQSLASVPLVVSLAGAVFQILRDQAAHDRAIMLMDAQNHFTLAATSHMAIIAFDKHVQFCEEYIAEVHKVLATLFREGPTAKVLEHTPILNQLQQKYSLWLTASIVEKIDSFELSLRRLGAQAHYLNVAEATNSNREQIVTKMFKEFADLMGKKFMGDSWEGEQLTEERAVSKVVDRFRVMLGIEELTEMRQALVAKAIKLEGSEKSNL